MKKDNNVDVVNNNGDTLEENVGHFLIYLLGEKDILVLDDNNNSKTQNQVSHKAISSFYKAITVYKNENDDKTAQSKKETSEFLVQLMNGYREKLGINHETTIDNFQITKEMTHKASQHLYNLLIIIRIVLKVQRELKGLKNSEMMKQILKSLSYIFSDNLIVFKKISRGNNDNIEAKRQHIDGIVEKIDSLIERLDENAHVFADEAHINDHIAGLIRLASEKEKERGSRSRKREKIYEIVGRYLLSDTPDDVIALFQAMKEGIELSRKHGHDKEKSAQLELKVQPFRDALVNMLVIRNSKCLDFKEGDYQNILKCISYQEETCPYAMQIIDKAFKNSSRQEIDLQKIQQFCLLFYTIPRFRNGMEISKAKYVLQMGSEWCFVLQGLVDRWRENDSRGPEINMYACLWNFYIYSCYKDFGELFDERMDVESMLYTTAQKQVLLIVPPEKIYHDLIDEKIKHSKDNFFEFSNNFNDVWAETDMMYKKLTRETHKKKTDELFMSPLNTSSSLWKHEATSKDDLSRNNSSDEESVTKKTFLK